MSTWAYGDLITAYRMNNPDITSITVANDIHGNSNLYIDNIYPNANNTYNIGAADNTVASIYANSISASSVTVGGTSVSLSGHTHSWDNITSKPDRFAPENHYHPISDISDSEYIFIKNSNILTFYASDNGIFEEYDAVFQVDNTSSILDFNNTPTVNGNMVSIVGHEHDFDEVVGTEFMFNEYSDGLGTSLQLLASSTDFFDSDTVFSVNSREQVVDFLYTPTVDDVEVSLYGHTHPEYENADISPFSIDISDFGGDKVYNLKVNSSTVYSAYESFNIVNFTNAPTVEGTSVSIEGHTHDDRYYTESEVDSAIGDIVEDKNYVYEQTVPSATWTINHTLEKKPSVSVVDSGGNEVMGEVEYVSTSQIIVTFIGAFAGEAYLN